MWVPLQLKSKIDELYNRKNWKSNWMNIQLAENRLRVPRTGRGANCGCGKPPMLRLDSTSSSSNFLLLMDRVELLGKFVFSINQLITMICLTVAHLRRWFCAPEGPAIPPCKSSSCSVSTSEPGLGLGDCIKSIFDLQLTRWNSLISRNYGTRTVI